MGSLSSAIRAIGALWYVLRGDRERLAGHYDRAEQNVRRGLALARRAGRFRPVLEARLLNSLGMLRKHQGLFERGARAYRRGLRLARNHLPNNHALFACLYHNMAGLEHARGQFSLAEPFARIGLSLRARAHGSRHPDVARDLAALAAILDGQRRHGEAESLHRRALQIFQRSGRSERGEIAYALGNLAACLHLMGRPEAIEIAREAASMQVNVLGPHHPDTQLTLANVAAIENSFLPCSVLAGPDVGGPTGPDHRTHGKGEHDAPSEGI